ncbi:unnamed protein product [Clavelina lepadiformis]|uniref:Uncharacterized protein n=1 Tax=Clavelina lepadiformis TaxID=159417 RepID=A0ABP0GZR6_CLALP
MKLFSVTTVLCLICVTAAGSNAVFRELQKLKYSCSIGQYPAATGGCEDCSLLCKTPTVNCRKECIITFIESFVLTSERNRFHQNIDSLNTTLNVLIQAQKEDYNNLQADMVSKEKIYGIQLHQVEKKQQNELNETNEKLDENKKTDEKQKQQINDQNTRTNILYGIILFCVVVVSADIIVRCIDRKRPEIKKTMRTCTTRNRISKNLDRHTENNPLTGLPESHDPSNEEFHDGPRPVVQSNIQVPLGTAKYTAPKSSV